MGTLWDSFIEGYNNPGGVAPIDTPSVPDSADAPATPWDKLIGGSQKKPSSEGGGRRVVDEDYVVEGLVARGMPEHIAQGFAMNFADESGFDSGINEINPLVEGSRGGYGLYQLTGPRRRQYEAFAAERGVDAADADAQLDFLMWELENTEKSAARSIYGATSAGEAGAAIVHKFLRPHESHRERRASKYLGQGARTDAPPPRNKLWLDF